MQYHVKYTNIGHNVLSYISFRQWFSFLLSCCYFGALRPLGWCEIPATTHRLKLSTALCMLMTLQVHFSKNVLPKNTGPFFAFLGMRNAQCLRVCSLFCEKTYFRLSEVSMRLQLLELITLSGYLPMVMSFQTKIPSLECIFCQNEDRGCRPPLYTLKAFQEENFKWPV